MGKKGLLFLNLFLAGIAVVLLFVTCGFALLRPKTLEIPQIEAYSRPFPKNAFSFPKASYDAIENTLLILHYAPPTIQVPNLQPLLTYYGPNGRPDTGKDAVSLYFALMDGKSQGSIAPEDKLYLLYDRSQSPPRYVFSPNNAPTSLWMEAHAQGNDVRVKVFLKDQNGTVINTPLANSEFTLQQKDMGRVNLPGSASWEIGKWKVDATLLSRQKARWFGLDRFLEKHGGEEFQSLANKQRIDFGEGDDAYSIYAGLNDVLIWKNDQWTAVKPGKDSQGLPLMQLKKVEDRLLSFMLWDPEGKTRLTLNLLKSTDNWTPKNLQHDFKFIASRTRSQVVFEVQKERMLLQPKDWLVLTPTGWKKLNSAQEIDDYVDRKITGPLFIFDDIVRKEDKTFLIGTLFSASRTEVQPVELDLSQGTMNVIALPTGKKNTSNPVRALSPEENISVPVIKSNPVPMNVSSPREHL